MTGCDPSDTDTVILVGAVVTNTLPPEQAFLRLCPKQVSPLHHRTGENVWRLDTLFILKITLP